LGAGRESRRSEKARSRVQQKRGRARGEANGKRVRSREDRRREDSLQQATLLRQVARIQEKVRMPAKYLKS